MMLVLCSIPPTMMSTVTYFSEYIKYNVNFAIISPNYLKKKCILVFRKYQINTSTYLLYQKNIQVGRERKKDCSKN